MMMGPRLVQCGLGRGLLPLNSTSILISIIPHLQQWKPRYKYVGKWKQRNNAQSCNYQLSQSKIYDILLLASAVMMNFWMMQNFSEHCATTFYKRRERRVEHLHHIHTSLVDSARIDVSRKMNNDKKNWQKMEYIQQESAKFWWCYEARLLVEREQGREEHQPISLNSNTRRMEMNCRRVEMKDNSLSAKSCSKDSWTQSHHSEKHCIKA